MCAIIVLELDVMTKNFVEPEYEKKEFTCFKCGTYSNHDWRSTNVNYSRRLFEAYTQGEDVRKLSICRW